jgi:N-acetyltransferase
MHIDLNKLRGRYVYLEFLQPNDIEIIRPLAKDERIWEFTKRFSIDDKYDAAFDAYISTALDKNAMGGQQVFIIRQSSDNAIIGMTRLYEITPPDKRATIGYTWYVPLVWGKVHNKECKFLLLQLVFEEWAFNRVEFRVAHQNIRSQKAVEKIGALKEGVLRKYGYRSDGSLHDAFVFSIINDEWPSKKEKLLQLMAENENQ